jgi:leucyl-tRNA synthetase
MEPNFTEIEQKWQKYWQENQVYKTNIDSTKPKFYVLDMFPYPSGAGLHVGHPLGYIASDIVSRYKRLKGFNVLHPMGFDAFGLPAEQYAIQTGRHPADTSAENIARYKEQLNNIGFCYDWSREVNTSEPNYYKWTQWIFLQLFDSWYNENAQKAEPIATLITHFEQNGTNGISSKLEEIESFTAQHWKEFSVEKQRTILMQFRLAYQAYSTVNWCEGLGTVLANDEVKDGFSERGGFPVEKRQMRQWFLRITAYAERLLNDLNTLEWSDSMKEMQRNWIGKSEGASIRFQLENHSEFIEVFTTRPDTIFGVDFLTLAPEHELVAKITTADCKDKVESYINTAKNRSERERMADVKRISGEFTGAYVIHPFSGSKIPVWIGDYVLAGYGTGAVMAVPAGDQRDWDFAKHFNLPITPINKDIDISEAANPTKEAQMINSDFLNGLTGYEAMKKAIAVIEEKGLGMGKVNFRLRDAGFSRQRYWGEPFPIIYKNDQPYAISETELPLHLPVMEDFKPTGKPESPLVKATEWVNTHDGKRETDTMPGYAGSSWYFLRYMDPQNDGTFVGKEAESYWQDVDLYIGGTEHAVGHLLYARFWQKFLFDRGHVSKFEPFKKLVNQGMILGRSNFVYQIVGTNTFISKDLLANYKNEKIVQLHVDVNIVQNDILNTNAFKKYRSENSEAEFVLNAEGNYVCGVEVEKMSKSKYNVVNPDDIINEYGADTLRLYEMFLGPLEQSKPWNTNGIEGVYRFLNKLWRMFYNDNGTLKVNDVPASEKALRTLHKTLKKIEEDVEKFSFNTSVSSFMICVNELNDEKCTNKAALRDLLIAIAPFAPHIAEELWAAIGEKETIFNATFPQFNEAFIKESSIAYPVAFNGKVRYQLNVAADMPHTEVQTLALQHADAEKWLEGAAPKKVIVVPGRMVNVVI